MKAFLLLLAVTCLVAADIQCPNSDVYCPDGKRCCEVDGQHTCCDAGDESGDVRILEGKMKVYAGDEILEHSGQYPNASMTDVQHGFLTNCNFITCKGKCCSSNFCCPYAGNPACCPEVGKCCVQGTICCPVGCCPKGQDCCAGGCCASGQRCCGQWCCKKKQQCGTSFNTCYGTGVTFTPAVATVLLLAAAAIVSRHL